MHVRDYMTVELITTRPSASLQDARSLLLSNKIRHLPLVEGDQLVGITTQTDVIEHVAEANRTHRSEMDLLQYLDDTPIEVMMVRDPITAAPLDTIERAALLMRDRKVGCLPVVEDGKLLGLITETNVFDALVDALGMRQGGARMTYEIEDGDEYDGVRRVLAKLAEDDLMPVALAIFRPRRGERTPHIVARVKGRRPPE